MQIRLLKSKLHMAAVTGTNLHYHGSITIDEDLIDAAGLLPYEAVLIANVSTGVRGETYVLKGERGKRQIELNGAMARLATTGDRLIILSFAYLEPQEVAKHKPKIAVLDSHNGIVEQWEG
jgi:aspartate 1-decarboxylase